MGYTPNNPYIPGDPYSYDLKWFVENLNRIKSDILQLEKTYTTPTVVDMASEMVDVNKIYVYVGNEVGYQTNHWYFYDLDTHLWTDGGIYGSITPDIALDVTSTNAVENKAITTAINSINSDIGDINTDIGNLVNSINTKQDVLAFPLSGPQGGTGMTGPTLDTNDNIPNTTIIKWGHLTELYLQGATVNGGGSIGTLPSDALPHTYFYASVWYSDGVSALPGLLLIQADGSTSVLAFNGSTYVNVYSGTVHGIAAYIATSI